MSPTRRDFILGAAGAALCGCSPGPSWYPAALRTLRAEGKPGLVFRIPAAAADRCALGHELGALAERTDTDALEITLQAVLLCLDGESLRSRVDGVRPGEDLVLIDGHGVAHAGTPLDLGLAFTGQVAELLEGPGLSRLRARAATSKEAALFLRRRETIDAGLEAAIAALVPPAPRLPYGAEFAAGAKGGCREDAGCTGRGCGACGLASVNPRSRAFVKFLSG